MILTCFFYKAYPVLTAVVIDILMAVEKLRRMSKTNRLFTHFWPKRSGLFTPINVVLRFDIEE